MSWSFKPGDRVVCVNAENPSAPGPWYLVEGKVFTIKAIINQTGWSVFGDFRSETCLVLEEIPGVSSFGDLADGGYAAHRFRPVRTTSIESLRAHLNTIPANRSVDA